MLSVKPFRLAHFVEPQEHEGNVALFYELHRLLHESLLLFAVAIEALFDPRNRQAVFLDTAFHRIELGGIYDGGTRALIAGLRYKVADDRDLRILFEGKNAVVLKEHNALFRALFRYGVVRFRIEFLALFYLFRRFYER